MRQSTAIVTAQRTRYDGAMMAVLVAAAVDAPQCSSVPLKQMIANYAELIHKQDSDAIAHLFGTDGEIDNPGASPIRGETAVKGLLSGFKGAVVTSETMTVEKIEAVGNAWHATGRFHQAGRTPAAKDYDVSGRFDSDWTCGPDGWRVRRMATGK